MPLATAPIKYIGCEERTFFAAEWLRCPRFERRVNAGLNKGESYAMHPSSAVSGFYFSHPESRYFGVAEVGWDQASDHTSRKGKEAEKWLAPNLAYDPE